MSWQVVPRCMDRMVSDPDPKKVGRAFKAMLMMNKFGTAELERAFQG